MNVLIACEESQRVCIAFRERGHNAFSCDLQECSGGHPEWHIKGDCLLLLNGNCRFFTQDLREHEITGKWNLLIAHPPCTYLTVSGNAWFDTGKYGKAAWKRMKERNKAIAFFYRFVMADCDKIAIENPVGVMGTAYRKADQIIQPYMFGEKARKATCLWLKGLPKLQATNIVDCGEIIGNFSVGASTYYAVNENGKILRWNDPMTAKIRSRTYNGIAKAMGDQWGDEKGKQLSI